LFKVEVHVKVLHRQRRPTSKVLLAMMVAAVLSQSRPGSVPVEFQWVAVVERAALQQAPAVGRRPRVAVRATNVLALRLRVALVALVPMATTTTISSRSKVIIL
jgi:hypothetical protein